MRGRKATIRLPACHVDQRIGSAVLQAALGPQRVDAARDLQRAAGADVALEDFAVVADRLDDVDDPVVGQAEIGADLGVGLDAEHALDLRDWRRPSSPRHWPG